MAAKINPELNDIEVVWHDLKAYQLSHKTFTDVSELDGAIHTAVKDLNCEQMVVQLANPRVFAKVAKGLAAFELDGDTRYIWNILTLLEPSFSRDELCKEIADMFKGRRVRLDDLAGFDLQMDCKWKDSLALRSGETLGKNGPSRAEMSSRVLT